MENGIYAAFGFQCLVIIFLGILLFLQQKEHAKNITALVERLMAKNLAEYEQAKKPPAPPRVVINNEPPMEDMDRILG